MDLQFPEKNRPIKIFMTIHLSIFHIFRHAFLNFTYRGTLHFFIKGTNFFVISNKFYFSKTTCFAQVRQVQAVLAAAWTVFQLQAALQAVV